MHPRVFVPFLSFCFSLFFELSQCSVPLILIIGILRTFHLRREPQTVQSQCNGQKIQASACACLQLYFLRHTIQNSYFKFNHFVRPGMDWICIRFYTQNYVISISYSRQSVLGRSISHPYFFLSRSIDKRNSKLGAVHV